MRALSLTDESLGERMGVAKNTVWRWRSEPQRLDAEKLERLSQALGLDSPADLWHRPGQRRVDPLLAGASSQAIDDVIDFVKKFIIPRETP